MNYYFSSKKLISSALAFCLASTTLNAYLPEDVHTTLDDTDQELTKKNNKSQKTNKRIQNPYSLSVVDPTLKNTLQDQSSLHFRQTGVLDISANAIETITDLSTFAYSVVNLGEGSTLNLGSNGDGRLDPKSSLTINFNGANAKVYGGSTYSGKNNINIDVARTGVFYLPDDHSNGTLYLKSLTLQDSSSMSFIGGKQLEIQNLISGANATLTLSTNNQFDSSQTVHLGSQMDGDTSTLELSGHRSSSGSSIYGITFWFDSPNAQNTIKHLTTNDGYHQIFLKGSLTIKDKVEFSSNQTAQKYLTFAFNDNQSENILKFENGIDVGGSASATFYFFDGIGKIITKDNVLTFNEGYIGFKFSPNSTGAFSYLLDEQGNIGRVINGTSTEIEFRGGDSTFVANIHTIDTQTQGKSPGYTNFKIIDYANSAKHYGNITSEGLGKNYLSFFNKQYEKEIAFYGEDIHFSQIQFYGERALLTLDSSHNNIIMQVDNIEKLSTSTATSGILHLNFRSQDNQAIFKLFDPNTTLKSVSVENGTNNTLAISHQGGGVIEIDENVDIGQNKGITFDLSTGSNITFTRGLNNAGSTSFNLGQTNILSGAITNSGTLSFNVLENSNLQYANGLSFSTGENNIIFKKDNTSLNWQDSNGTTQAITTKGGVTNIEFNNSGTIAGKITTTGGHTILSVAQGKTGIINGNIETINANTNIEFHNNGILELHGNSNILSNINVTSNDKIVLKQGKTSIVNTINIAGGQGLSFNLEQNSTLSLKSITTAGSLGLRFATTNFNIQGGAGTTNIISGNIITQEIESNGGLTVFNIGDQGKAITTGNIETNGSGSTSVVFNGKSNLTLQGQINEFTDIAVDPSGKEGTLTLDGSNSKNGVTASVSQSIGNKNINLNFNGIAGKGAEITLSVGSNALKAITLADGSSDTRENKLILLTGNTSVEEAINIGSDQALEIDLGNSTLSGSISNAGETILAFNGENGSIIGDISTTAGNTFFDFGNIDGSTQNVVAIVNGNITNTQNASNTFSVNATNATFKTQSGFAFSAGENNIAFTKDNASLKWQDSSGNSQAIKTSGGTTNIQFKTSGTIDGAISTVGGITTLSFDEGVIGVISENINTSTNGTTILDFNDNATLQSSISTSGTNAVTNINIANGITGTITGTITSTTGTTNVEFNGNNSVLILKDNATITSIRNSTALQSKLGDTSAIHKKNNGISFYHDKRNGDEFKTLNIGEIGSTQKGIKGEGLNFLVYATSNKNSNAQKTYSDKIVIHSSSNGYDLDGTPTKSTHYLGVKFADNTNLEEIYYRKGGNDNILVATVADNSGVQFEKSEKTILGFISADVEYATESTDKDGSTSGTGYTSYYIKNTQNQEIIVAEQEITATAFALNYDLYMANLNSLNKRMGELRENAHSQGVWARVFNGAQTNKQGLGSKSNYTTVQAGYDYAFGFEGANNYLGFALSYALSTSTSDKAFDAQGQQREIGNIYSNAVEVAVYNSYVSDIGWYNDTIAKFSYLMSSFDIDNLNTGSTTKNDTNNFALTLGDEVGYVFKLGESKEWSIAPQVEFTFGYFNQSDFKQTLQNSGAYLASTADAVLTLRSRVGSSFGYDFKNFTQESGFNASLYVGAFYEYDYVSGGNLNYETNTTKQTIYNTLSDIKSDGRVVMNVGTNMTIKDNTRLYFDFEKSFAGNITTDYQVNFGVRYSFGEKISSKQDLEKPMPLKLKSEEDKEVSEEKKEDKSKNQEQSKASETKAEDKSSKKEAKK